MITAGIDFGTTNSGAAIAGKNTEPSLVAVENNHDTIPTALYFDDKSRNVYFGREAIEHYTNGESSGRFMRSVKRILGSSLMRSPGTVVNGSMMRFDKIIEKFVINLKEKIDISAGTNVESVVMGRPVHFIDNDPTGDKDAEEQLRKIAIGAGFKNVAFQYEPIAAAFAHERLLKSEKLACVVDIGGGTSDFTIIRLSPERKAYLDRTSDVLANTGVRVGGNDFDKDLSLKSFMPEFGLGTNSAGVGGKLGPHDKIIPMPSSYFFSLSTWNEVNDVYTYKILNQIKKYLSLSMSPEKVKRLLEIAENRLGHKNLGFVEDAKIKLSDAEDVNIILDFLSDTPRIIASRKDFETAIERNVDKIRDSVSECLVQSGVKSSDINLVILTGGSTEIPYISQTMQSNFPNAELSAGDKLSSVSLGLAYDSIRRFNTNTQILQQFGHKTI
jgi:hypothetical chaperone protein